MNYFFLFGLFIAAVSANPISDRIDKLESNLTHLWDMVHDMEEHHGGGVHIHLQTNDQDGGHKHESTHLKTDDDGAHVYLHMNMHDDFTEFFEDGEFSEHGDGHHHHHQHPDDLPDEKGEHHGPLDDHSDAKDDDDDDDDMKKEHNDFKNIHHHHHHHHHRGQQHHHRDLKEAHCDLVPNKDDTSGMTGHIHIKEIEHDLLSVHVDFKCPSDIAPGTKLALHVHEGSDMSNKCDSLGGHYNPHNRDHGSRTDAHNDRHAGDWSNVVCDSKNQIEHEFYERLSHLSGPHSIMNRSIVLHRGTDDHGRGESPDSKKSGAAGERLACCIITEKKH